MALRVAFGFDTRRPTELTDSAKPLRTTRVDTPPSHGKDGVRRFESARLPPAQRSPCAPHHERAGVRTYSRPVSSALPQRLSHPLVSDSLMASDARGADPSAICHRLPSVIT